MRCSAPIDLLIFALLVVTASALPTLRVGSTGSDVTKLQSCLGEKHGFKLAADGIFGPATEEAVKQFQRNNNLRPDGVVGSLTWNALRCFNTGNGSVIGLENTTPEFRTKAAEIAARLGMNSTHLLAVMSFETGGTFSPSIRNNASGATGLIQFMPSTARALNTTTEALARMSATEQLDYVERHLRPYSGRMKTVEDAYMAVLWPAAVGKGPDHVLFRYPSVQYQQNKGLDGNGDGAITAREAASKVRARIL